MSTTVHTATGEPGDAELISAVRDGDTSAYGELFARHVESARRLARQLVSAGDVDDLVSEAFAKVLVVLQRGGGPDLAFRAYLLTAVRRLHVDRIRATSRLQTTDDLTPYDPGVPFRDTAVEGFESAAAAKAFASLPERWQMVLWHTEVEELKPAEIAPLLGVSANSVSALAYRAREGLRQAFLSMHAQEAEDEKCEWTQDNLGAYVRRGCSRRDAGRVEHHLGECRRCTGIYLELTEVNSNLRGILAPLVLGSAAAGYLASTGGAGVATGGVVALFGRARDVVAGNASAAAVAGVAATAVIAGGIVIATQTTESPTDPGAEAPIASSLDPSSPDDVAVDPDPRKVPAPGNRRAGPAVVPLIDPEDPPTASPSAPPSDPATTPPNDDPAAPPSQQPSQQQPPGHPPVQPSEQPSHEPSGQPTKPPATEPTQPPTTAPPPTDLSVSATRTHLAGLLWAIDVQVTGVPTGETATLAMRSNGGTSLQLTLDPRCGLLSGGGLATCRVTQPSATYHFTALSLLVRVTLLTFTVTPDDSVDVDPSNNSTQVTLRPRG